MFVAEFLLGSLAFVYRDNIKHTFTEKLQDGLTHHYNMSEGSNNLVYVWDDIQSNVSTNLNATMGKLSNIF